ncbi:MAG TPA: rhomboid family intramembrane serine protease [Caldimonas sp.]|jgi:membrane associated rhomboid family serine protease|nr:rhomboid family intramembrane serine protease [Caldimonas sp.]HEX2539752.1 rhomboid family intramembrane serine protease [Caldimonas sp.]
MPPLPPVTQALLLANVAIFFLERLLGGGLFNAFALWPLGTNFWPWQIVTYSFLHGSFEHLFFNMLGLWMFGAELENVWGQRRYLHFYFASVLAAALTQLLVNALLGSSVPTVGASGGLFGLLLAFAMLFPNRIILLFFVIPMKAKYLVLLFGIIELYQGAAVLNTGVAHFAHLGGMLGGLLTIRYWRGQPPFRRR